ncbi:MULTISPECIES: LysR substrate-binding domain-containing protein [unclassified Mesorhizobium]|uniref:LysR substrate-binding domain-containing protein n=1 Tax=unclassified Mesorhizobium TaxID=325217 RepID=UPI000F75A045|nr:MULTISPECIES: LysR substrate-binding domain-containing protein [unclassified Mesorhizobium]TGT61145.1 LysR family transcriptional regulator [Mesorhizobium sp. M00.F.Ca.ET.170.01.1.1]AZO08913.1 LysR family transcriptional regulator [Mesorhizobium sp. M3A.F.Ca.ET.080.04.2.1]RWB68140.1 MAG: LysR family transcriptional regulator [Mesorhizobium sp.]RWE26515.1 MAG: LysR family transcriptional regulator [Mesorhizobium sp.]RWE28143.1 MAG: LysR family transcriptional regulator [Mesorhizobium sp.]
MRLLSQVNLNSLKIVESAARHKNFTRAGEEQFITASAVSQRVKSLEDQLRFKIFQRGGNAVSLTPEGEAYVAQVREALERIVAANMEATGQSQAHVLKICVLPTFAARWLFPRLSAFQRQYPEIEMRVSTSYATHEFATSEYDLEIRYGDGSFPGLSSELLFREDLTPVCSRKLFHEVLGNKPLSRVTPDDLRHFTLLHSETCTQNWQSWLRFAGASFVLGEAKSIYFDSCMMSYEAANAGMGFAVANRAYMASDIRAERLVAPFAVHHPNSAGWYFVCPGKAIGARKVSLFKQWIMAEAALTQRQLDVEITNLPVRRAAMA